jgi:hypothetical protein
MFLAKHVPEKMVEPPSQCISPRARCDRRGKAAGVEALRNTVVGNQRRDVPDDIEHARHVDHRPMGRPILGRIELHARAFCAFDLSDAGAHNDIHLRQSETTMAPPIKLAEQLRAQENELYLALRSWYIQPGIQKDLRTKENEAARLVLEILDPTNSSLDVRGLRRRDAHFETTRCPSDDVDQFCGI